MRLSHPGKSCWRSRACRRDVAYLRTRKGAGEAGTSLTRERTAHDAAGLAAGVGRVVPRSQGRVLF